MRRASNHAAAKLAIALWLQSTRPAGWVAELGSFAQSNGREPLMISKETLIGFFEDTRKLKATGKARFDIDEECRWSYFFTDTNRDKLTEAGRHLEKIGYEVRGFLDPSPDDESQTIFLRFDMIETNTPESLFERNASLYALPYRFGLDSYDGMDVGAVDGP